MAGVLLSNTRPWVRVMSRRHVPDHQDHSPIQHPFERDVEANWRCEILDVVRSEEKEDSPLETEEGEDFDGLLAADEEAADLKASRGAQDGPESG